MGRFFGAFERKRSAWKSPAAGVFLLVLILISGCDKGEVRQADEAAEPENRITIQGSRQRAEPEFKKRASSDIVAAAREQIGATVIYDGSYQRLKYPGGDVPLERGVCTDVVIRALRDSRGMDFQVLVHEDMNAAFHAYPKIWGLKKPDRNIDHRRVPNLAVYFKRKGYGLAVSQRKEDYLPGDIVTCTVPPNRPHIMIVSDRKSRDGTYFIIHNIGYGTVEENRLFEFPITGHYRIKSLGSVKVK